MTQLIVSGSGIHEFSNLPTGGSSTHGGYIAVKSTPRRRTPPHVTKSEDDWLTRRERRILISSVDQLRRNFSVAAWMIRRHLDFVSAFRFQARTNDDEVNKQFSNLVRLAGRADVMHSRGRFPLTRMIRTAEMLRTVHGDCGWLHLNSGHTQLIHGDRIMTPDRGDSSQEWRHGVLVDAAGRPRKYAVHKRRGTGFEFERLVDAKNMYLHGYYDLEDQTRGVSPLSTAINELADTYEFHDLTRVRAKVQSLLGVAFTRKSREGVGSWYDHDLPQPSAGEGEDAGDETVEPVDEPRYSIDADSSTWIWDLETDDDVKFLESGHPPVSLQQYAESMLILSLKSLDLPFSFLREDFTNFFGSKGAWLLYERACEPKRDDNIQLLDFWLTWKAIGWILSGDLVLPDNVTLDDHPWEFVPRKVPAFRRLEEIKADILAIGAGFTTPDGVCLEADENPFRENVQDTAESLEYARSKGLKMAWDTVDNPDLPPDDADEEIELPKKRKE